MTRRPYIRTEELSVKELHICVDAIAEAARVSVQKNNRARPVECAVALKLQRRLDRGLPGAEEVRDACSVPALDLYPAHRAAIHAEIRLNDKVGSGKAVGRCAAGDRLGLDAFLSNVCDSTGEEETADSVLERSRHFELNGL